MIEQKDVSGATAELQDRVDKVDVDAVGIARLDDWKGTRLEETALRLLPTARSVIIVVMEVFQEILDHAARGKRIDGASMKDWQEHHVEFTCGRVNEAAYDISRASRRMGLKALPLPSRGLPFNRRLLTPIFSFKLAAQSAGMGNIGRHSLVMTPEFGPRVRLACCLTEAALKPTPAQNIYECGKCRVCIENCPAGALAEPQGDEVYRINKFACSAFSAGQNCSECMRLCPAGR